MWFFIETPKVQYGNGITSHERKSHYLEILLHLHNILQLINVYHIIVKVLLDPTKFKRHNCVSRKSQYLEFFFDKLLYLSIIESMKYYFNKSKLLLTSRSSSKTSFHNNSNLYLSVYIYTDTFPFKHVPVNHNSVRIYSISQALQFFIFQWPQKKVFNSLWSINMRHVMLSKKVTL